MRLTYCAVFVKDTLDVLYDIKNMLKDVYRNYKKAQNKIKELKMSGDFSE